MEAMLSSDIPNLLVQDLRMFMSLNYPIQDRLNGPRPMVEIRQTGAMISNRQRMVVSSFPPEVNPRDKTELMSGSSKSIKTVKKNGTRSTVLRILESINKL